MSWAGARRLKELLNDKNRRQVARDLGLHYTTLMGYQAGRRAPDVATLVDLCRYLNASADDLLGLVTTESAVAEARSHYDAGRIEALVQENDGLRTELQKTEAALEKMLTARVLEIAEKAAELMKQKKPRATALGKR